VRLVLERKHAWMGGGCINARRFDVWMEGRKEGRVPGLVKGRMVGSCLVEKNNLFSGYTRPQLGLYYSVCLNNHSKVKWCSSYKEYFVRF
jgi:hypothetical protein